MRLSILQKIGLIVLGILLFLVILDVALNIGGFIFLELQEYRNLRSFKQKGVYRILCLGESTTALGWEDSYPSQLESILNQRKAGLRFSVINNGVVGIDSSTIVSRLDGYLNKYHPDMVIVMMGINDTGNHMPRETISNSKVMLFLGFFKTYKLARMIWLHFATKVNKNNIDKQEVNSSETGQDNVSKSEYKLKKIIEINPNDDHSYFELGLFYAAYYCNNELSDISGIDEAIGCKNDLAYVGYGCVYLKKNDIPAAELSFIKALELNPKNDFAYIGLGSVYISKNDVAAAETSFLRALDLNPKNSLAYIELAWLSEEQGKLTDAEELFKKAIEVDPYNDKAYVELGRIAMLREDFAYAHKLFKKARYLNNNNFGITKYFEFIGKDLGLIKVVNKMFKLSRRDKLGHIELSAFRKLIVASKASLAEESFKKAINLNKKNSYAHYELGRVYKNMGKISEAEEELRKAIELNPLEFLAYSELGWIFIMKEDLFKAEELFRKAAEADHNNDKAYGAMVTLAQEKNDVNAMEKYQKKANDLRSRYYIPATVANYRKFKDILEKRKIKLVCAQYPIRSIEPLKSIFTGQDDVIFVDNEETFKQAVLKASYREYFIDIFAGDFGHCTPKGNKLLAENIADVILREVFNQKQIITVK